MEGQRNQERELRVRRWFAVLVPLFAAAFALLVVEVGVAVLRPVPYAVEFNMYYEPDPVTGFRAKPNSTGIYQNGYPANANSRGHRDEEMALPKPPGLFRILVLGDSFTVGANVTQEEAYPEVLETLLRARFGGHIEVVNSGTDGWDPYQYAQYFEHYGQHLEADLVLVGFFVGNDAYAPFAAVEQLQTAVLGRRVNRDTARSPLIRLKVMLYEHSHLARLLMNSGPVMVSVTRQGCADFNDWYLRIQTARLPNHLKRDRNRMVAARNGVNQVLRVRDLAAAHGVPLVVALLPDETQINPQLRARIIKPEEADRYDFAMPQAMLSEMFAGASVPVIDLMPEFLADPRCLYMNDTHWTAEGHRLAAAALERELLRLHQARSVVAADE
jgi:hypothetical protein